jgi:acyl-CoA hydrolase
MTARRIADSSVEMTEILLPQHANALGTAFGGTIMSWIDICGAICAQRHCGRIAVTAYVDDLEFLAPIRVGDIVQLHARMNQAFGSSMEVEVEVKRERAGEAHLARCAVARLTFVNVGPDGRPAPVPALVLETDEARLRAKGADERRAQRLAHRKRAVD